MTRSAALAAAVAAGLALAAPAAAQTTPEPPVPGPTFYFECTGPTKVQNNERVKRWSPTAPATSYTAGGGCGTADPGLVQGTRSNTAYDGSWGGLYGGKVDTIQVELHSLLLSQARLGAEMPLKARLLVDGEELYDETAPPQVDVTPVLSPTGLTEKYVFTYTNLRLPALPEGEEREIVIDVGTPFLDYQHAWVWGATEIPAGVQINPLKPAKPFVRRAGSATPPAS